MKQSKKNAERSSGQLPGKRPYVKPSCASEPIYETLALACGKMPGQQGICQGVPRKS
jgi:hypothetical protein